MTNNLNGILIEPLMVTDVGIKELWQGQCFSGSLKLWIIICPMSVLALTPGWEPAMSPVHTLEPNQFYLFRPNESNICWGVFSHSLITWSQAGRKYSVKCLTWPFSAHCFKPYWLQTWHESKGELVGQSVEVSTEVDLLDSQTIDTEVNMQSDFVGFSRMDAFFH